MRFTDNLNLPILQDGDKYSKDVQNTAFEKIDTEIAGVNKIVESVKTIDFNKVEADLNKLDSWDRIFQETSGKIEEKYATRLNGIDSSLEQNVQQTSALAQNKVDKVIGKGLSTFDYDNNEKSEVAKIKNKIDKVVGKGLSTFDYDNNEKLEVSKIKNKVDKVIGKGLSTFDYDNNEKSEVSKIKNKADVTFVNEKVAQIVSGSPKGVYPTLSGLQSAKPNGDVGIYVAAGKWCYWNGTAWLEGGVYQATAIADKEITITKLQDGEDYEKQMGFYNDRIDMVEIAEIDNKQIIVTLTRKDEGDMNLYRFGINGLIAQAILIPNNTTYTVRDYETLVWDYNTTSIKSIPWNSEIPKNSMILLTNYDGKVKDGYFARRANYIRDKYIVLSKNINVKLANVESLYIYNTYNQFPTITESNGVYLKWNGLISLEGDVSVNTSREYVSVFTEVGAINQDQSGDWVQNCIRIRENKSLVFNMYKAKFEIVSNAEITKSYYIVLARNTNGMITEGVLKDLWMHENLRKFKIREGGIPTYYKDHVTTKENTVIGKENENSFNFAFTTDNHIQEHEHLYPLHSHNILNKLKDSLNLKFILNGGDTVPYGRDEKHLSFEALKTGINKYSDKIHYYNAQGNHDTNAKSGVTNHLISNLIPQNDIYKILGKHLDSEVVWGDKGYMYYYKDLNDKKIRLIVLNNSDVPIQDNGSGKTTIDILETLGMRQHQVNWLANTALKFDDKADKSEWEVIILSHYFTVIDGVNGGCEWKNRTQVHEILKAFVNGTSTTQTNADNIFNLNVTADFRTQGAKKIIGYFCGHCHFDFMRIVDGIPFISSQADYKSNWHANCPDMTAGTYTEIAFDVVTVDKPSKIVKLTRFGAGADREYTY